jgi:hypothetical protein
MEPSSSSSSIPGLKDVNPVDARTNIKFKKKFKKKLKINK